MIEFTLRLKKVFIKIEKELQKEIDNHNATYANINNTSQKIINSYKKDADKENLQKRIEEINKRWILLRKKSLEIRSRLESNSSQWSALINSLNELIVWCKNQQYQLQNKKQNLQIDQNYLEKIINEFKVYMCNIEYKKSFIESTITSARLYYDDKDDTHNTQRLVDFDDNDELKIDEELKYLNKMNECDQAEYIVKKIQKKVKILEFLWNKLQTNTHEFNLFTINLNENLINLYKKIDYLNQKLNEYEKLINDMKLNTQNIQINNNNHDPNENIKIIENLNKIKQFQTHLNSNQSIIDEMNTKYSQICNEFLNKNSLDSQQIDIKLNTINKRYTNLINNLNEHYTNLSNHIENIGADNIFLRLGNSVQPPWQRSISTQNKIPYYINHSTETTSWEHPKMIELYKSFNNLNDIRFSAYRTSMKLRTLQKRLWLDLVDINDAFEAFNKNSLRNNNERNLEINQIIQCLNTLFLPASKQHAQIINIVHAIDLTLNWLLSVYDPSRCGQIRVMSMKVALVLLCKGSIEDKYKYIFNLIADEDGLVTQRKLGLLLYDMIMIPKQLGEVAAFGGSNIEPSVRSCFEYAKNATTINLKNFLDWLKLEPQSIVWLPVLHRLAAAETARHEAKCSICKEYPIVGFRYRSLKHFNFDICQNCFFSGRKIKGFKFDHPLLEYYTPTSSSDDIKDFFRIFRNKFRSKRSKRSGKLGYLPVQTVLEGDDFESPLTQSPMQSPLQSPVHTNQKPEQQQQQQQQQQNESITIVRTINPVEEKKTKMHSSNSQLTDSDDEHIIIAQYCQALHTSGINSSKEASIMTSSLSFNNANIQQNDATELEQLELENQIMDLEEENKFLMEEYNRLKAQLNATSSYNKVYNTSVIPQQFSLQSTMPVSMHQQINANTFNPLRDSTNQQYQYRYRSSSKERSAIEEAKLLRQHESRLEARMKILESHNRLLDAQLKQLRSLLNHSKDSGSKFSTISASSVASSKLNDGRRSLDRLTSSNAGSIYHNVDDITRAINNLNDLVNTINNEKYEK